MHIKLCGFEDGNRRAWNIRNTRGVRCQLSTTRAVYSGFRRGRVYEVKVQVSGVRLRSTVHQCGQYEIDK